MAEFPRADLKNIERLDALVEPMLRAARIPGAAIAIVAGEQTVFARGYGYCNLEAQLPVTPDTVYPIASTTKAINATLIGMLVDEGKLAWDAPVQEYLPGFRLGDSAMSAQITLRDLVTMRTGLPRHDWLWIDNPIGRAELVERLRHLDLSAGFRERFQYNNVTVTAAGHVAEVVAAKSWEELVRQKILEPLQMRHTEFELPKTGNITRSYHENGRRELLATGRLASEVTAPSGGAIHSTVEDMARWMAVNLNGGQVQGCQLIQSKTLAQIQAAQVAVGADPSCPTPNATYAMGWFVDTYGGHARLVHGGYIHDVSSDVMLFPQAGIGMVSFTNFGPVSLARLINQHVFDLIMGLATVQTLEEKLAQYEAKIAQARERHASVRRVIGTSPSHPLSDYAGSYEHPGYGKIEIQRHGEELIFRRSALVLPLEHWHYDAWIARENDIFWIHTPHPFGPTSRLLFETNEDGQIASVTIRLEPAVDPIRFWKLSG